MRRDNRRAWRVGPSRAVREAAVDSWFLYGGEGRVAAGGAVLLLGPAHTGRRSDLFARRGRRRATAAGTVATVRQDRARSAISRLQRVGVRLFTLIALVSIVLAAATIWLFVTNPATVANAVTAGEISTLVRQLAQLLYNALGGILKYL